MTLEAQLQEIEVFEESRKVWNDTWNEITNAKHTLEKRLKKLQKQVVIQVAPMNTDILLHSLETTIRELKLCSDISHEIRAPLNLRSIERRMELIKDNARLFAPHARLSLSDEKVFLKVVHDAGGVYGKTPDNENVFQLRETGLGVDEELQKASSEED